MLSPHTHVQVRLHPGLGMLQASQGSHPDTCMLSAGPAQIATPSCTSGGVKAVRSEPVLDGACGLTDAQMCPSRTTCNAASADTDMLECLNPVSYRGPTSRSKGSPAISASRALRSACRPSHSFCCCSFLHQHLVDPKEMQGLHSIPTTRVHLTPCGCPDALHQKTQGSFDVG